MVISKRMSDRKKFVEVRFVRTIFVVAVFVRTVFVASITFSHVVTESPIILSKCSPFLQVHVAGFAHMMFFQIFALRSTFIIILFLI